MSGRDVVRARRENAGSPPRRGLISVDLVLGIVALVAVLCCAFVGGRWITAGPPPLPVPAIAQSDTSGLAWTRQDSALCETRANAAAAEGVPTELAMANQAITDGGFAILAARVACRATVKAARLCDPAQKAELVALVNDYMARRDLLVLGLDVQGAPMAVIGGIMGGEAEMGSAVYEMTKHDTLAYMAIHHDRVVAKLQALAHGGILSAADFGFFGLGISPAIAAIFSGTAVTKPICG